MGKTKNIFFCIICLSSVAAATNLHAERKDRFFTDQERGWFFYEPVPEEPEEPEPQKLPPPIQQAAAPVPEPNVTQQPAPSPQQPPPGSAEWLRQAIPQALDVATDNPTYGNVARYFLLQKEALDKSEKFADMASLVTTGHPQLDESRRRPHADKFAKLKEREATDATKGVLQDLFKTTALVLFLDSSCSGCALMANNLTRLEKTHGLVWRVVSLDGTVLPPNFNAPTVFDQGISQDLGVEAGGALFLVTPPNKYDPVTWTSTSSTEIVDRILRVAYRSGLITQKQYEVTKAINPMVSTPQIQNPQQLPDILTQADEYLKSGSIILPEKGSDK